MVGVRRRVWQSKSWGNSSLAVVSARDHSNRIYQTSLSIASKHFFKHFLSIVPNIFRCQLFASVSEKLGEKVPLLDMILCYGEKTYNVTSLDENCIGFEFQTDRNYYVGLSLCFLVFELELIKAQVTIRTTTTKAKKHKETVKAGSAGVHHYSHDFTPIFFYTDLNNNLHSIFCVVEFYISNQEIYNSNRFSAHESYISENLNRSINEREWAYHCEGFLIKNVLIKLWTHPCRSFFYRENKIDWYTRWFHVVW